MKYIFLNKNTFSLEENIHAKRFDNSLFIAKELLGTYNLFI